MKTFISEVPGFEGECAISYINTNKIDARIFGGYTGFFRLVKKHWLLGKIRTGKQFHGAICTDHKTIVSTEGVYNHVQFINRINKR